MTLSRNDLGLVEDLVQPISFLDPSRTIPKLYCLKRNLPVFDADLAEIHDFPSPSLQFLAPLDPLIYDRRLASALWDFDYTGKAYTLAHKRVRGYYSLPVIAGNEFVGYIDAKADRQAGKLLIVLRHVRRGHRIKSAIQEFAE